METYLKTYLRRASSRELAALGIIFSLFPLYFVAASVLKYGFGVALLFGPLEFFFSDPLRLRVLNVVLTPILFFGGLLAALALNLYAVFRLRAMAGGGGGALSGFAARARSWNVVVVVLSSLLLAVVTTYGILENLATASG